MYKPLLGGPYLLGFRDSGYEKRKERETGRTYESYSLLCLSSLDGLKKHRRHSRGFSKIKNMPRERLRFPSQSLIQSLMYACLLLVNLRKSSSYTRENPWAPYIRALGSCWFNVGAWLTKLVRLTAMAGQPAIVQTGPDHQC